MDIRRALPADASGIAAVNVRSWQAAYRDLLPAPFLEALSAEGRIAFWKKALASRDAATFVAEAEGRIQAFISRGLPGPGGATAPGAEIWALYALPDAWGRGMGRALMHAAERHLRAAGCPDVSLWVLAGNRRGRGFHEAAGFVRRAGASRHREIGGARIEEVGYVRGFA